MCYFQVIAANKTDAYTGEICNVHEDDRRSSKTASIMSVTSLMSTSTSSLSQQTTTTATTTTNDSQSPVHKRSNIFKSKFLSKINPGSPQKPIAEEHLAPTVTMSDL